MRALVAIHHDLGDFRFDAQHALDPLRRNVVAAGIDDDVFLPVGDHQIAVFVEMPDIASMQPAILDGFRGPLRLVPVSLHHEFTADQDFAVPGDPDLDPLQRRTDRGDLVLRIRVTVRYRRAFGLTEALQDGQAKRLEKHPDIIVQRRATGHERFQPTAEPVLDLAADQLVEQQIGQPFVPAQAFRVFISLAAEGDGQQQQFSRQAPFLFRTTQHAGADRFVQARHGGHDRRANFRDVVDQLVDAFGVVDLRANADRHELAAGMFIGMAQRQERQENFVVVLHTVDRAHKIIRAKYIAQHVAMGQHHPGRRTAGAGCVDQAGHRIAGDAGGGFSDIATAGIAVDDQRLPVNGIQRPGCRFRQGFHRDQQADVILFRRRHEILRQPFV